MAFELTNHQVLQDMGQVDSELRRVLSVSRYSRPIRRALDYLVQSPGKRLRPLLVLLSYRSMCSPGVLPVKVVRLAVAIELIHMASLVHDDIIDAAEMRHGRPAFHQQFGTEIAIPVGVLLYSIALKLLADVGELDVIARVSRAVDQLCGGELDQVLSRNQFDISISDYLLVLKKKTSALFSLASWAGVRLAGATRSQSQHAFHFGSALGLLFQVSDDVLDFTGRAKDLLKGAHQDFVVGEITLPLIVLLTRLDSDQRMRAVAIMENRDWDGLAWLAEQLVDTGVIKECELIMRRYLDRCNDYLAEVPINDYSNILREVVTFISHRAK